jgi:hypothetical protein
MDSVRYYGKYLPMDRDRYSRIINPYPANVENRVS